MYIKSSADLIYISQGVLPNGSPYDLSYTLESQMVDEGNTFTNQYYSEQQRTMRQAKNLIIPSYLAEDIPLDNKMYELSQVKYNGKLYKVRNILKVKGTRQKVILDIQELL